MERRRSIINSLALLYQFATDAYQPFHSDNAGGTVGPTIKTTVSKGSGFYSDKKNPEKVELTSWLTKVNEDSTEELLFHLRQFHFALKSIRSVLDEVKSNGAECVTTTTAITLNSGKDQQDNMDFAYDNVLGVLELSPCLREIHVVEKLLR